MLPTRNEALKIIKEAETCNPGPWGDHSRMVARCAGKIAELTDNMNPEKAYIVGLLHDIGRKFGKRHLGHVADGYKYMMSLGYDEAARVCLTHSFNTCSIDDYIGKHDTTAEEFDMIINELSRIEMDDYDKLIQLCDSICGAGIILSMEDRKKDIESRYGHYPNEKWDKNIELRYYFERKIGKDIYSVIDN